MAVTQLTTIGNFATAAEAHAARLLLASQGIPAVLVDETLVGNFWYYGNAVGGVKLQVDAADDPRARQLLDEHATPAARDDGPSHGAAWTCPQCRERVPANFEVCWACGSLHGPEDIEVASLPAADSPAEPKPASRAKPNLPARESLCPDCGGTLHVASGVCPQCGARPALNPYEAPLSPTLAAVQQPPGLLRQQRAAADALAQRAWLSAVFGIVFLPPILNIYSVVLLVILAERHTRLSPRMLRRVTAAWAVNVIVLSITVAVLFRMFR